MNVIVNISKLSVLCSVAFVSIAGFSSGRHELLGREIYAQNDNDMMPPPAPPADDEAPPPPPPPPTPDDMPPEEPPSYDMDSPAPPSGASRSPKELGAPKSKEDEEAAAAEKALRFKEPPLIPVTEKEKATACRKYDKKFISYSGHVYFVKNCNKYLLEEEAVAKLTRKNNPPSEVIPRILASLGEGGDYETLNTKINNCQHFNKGYVTYNLKYYWAENCKLREFTDSASMQDHRWKHRFQTKPVPVLNFKEFTQFKIGPVFDSVLDKQEKPDPNANPIVAMANQQACKKLYGRYVSYYDSIYKIRNMKKGKGCWKEKLDTAEFTRKQKVFAMHELTSDESFSIPEEDPSDVKK